MGRVTTRVPVERLRLTNGVLERVRRPDTLAVEEPLEIRAGGQVVTVTMRTPGGDIDLVHGHLLAEGVIDSAEQVRGARYCAGSVATGPDGTDQNTYNIIEVDLVDAARAGSGLSRTELSTSACGVCGSASIDAIRERVPAPLDGPSATVTAGIIADLMRQLGEGQEHFGRTGGLHAAALGDTGGQVHALAEDVGRHNAVDKVIGAGLRAGVLPCPDAVLLVSSRASFEIVQKSAMARIPIVAVVSAPSSLAVETASALGLTLIAFARAERCNVYSGFERVTG